MALFGKKKADDATTSGAAAPAPIAAKARKVKEPRAPKAGTVKGGTVVGLNIGNAYIKAVEVTSKGGQLSVTGMGVIATPPESYANGNVLSVNALTGAIRQMWRQAGLSSKSTVFSVAGTGSLVVRVIEVPKMTDGELADNMRVDADRYIPFPPSEVVMDFKALRDLPNDPDAANMEVLLAAAQREIIDLHIGVVQKSKLSPRAIDVEPLALARTMQLDLRANNPIIDYDDVTAVLNIGQTGTEISIMRGDIVVFTRSVPNGGGNLTRAIAEAMGIPTSDAERLKIERGDALPPGGYGAGQQDDFGFGDFDDGSGANTVNFGGDFGDGGFDNDFGADPDVATGAATTTVTVTPTSAPASNAVSADTGNADTGNADSASAETQGSDDPFDLDFFDQGPQQSEPGAGHGQKEDDDDDAPQGINFSFDSLDDELSPSRSDEVAAPSATTSGSSTASGSAATPGLEELDLSNDLLPTSAAPIAPAPASQVPQMPSAFDFSDFDLPTAQQAPTASAPANTAAPTQKLSDSAPVIVPVAAPAPVSSGFGFSADAPAPQAQAQAEEIVIEPAISLDKTEGATSAGAPASDEPDDFDLDDVFGAPATGTVPDAAPATAPEAGGGFEANAFGNDDFDVSGLGAAAETDDFTSFGTGLSQTGETDDISLYNAIQPVLDDLATEVRRSLEFHLGRYPDTTFSRLVLVGGGAKLRNLDEFLAGSLGVPTSVGDPFAHIKVNVPGLPPEFAPTNAPLCAVALGLALRDFIE